MARRMRPTGFVFHRACLEHDTGPGHPERAERLRAIRARLEQGGLLAELDELEPRAATAAELALVHPDPYARELAAACARAPALLDADTPISPRSCAAALCATGGALEALERVASGAWRNAFCALRPPGHHAEPQRPMGFCLVNNVAVCARAAQRRHGLERVAIVDFDVHHGNGTQHAFEDDPTVFYASLHQWPFYPGTGARSERGRGAGQGATLNCPQPAGSGDAQWLAALEDEVLPALEDFQPDLLLLSAGFDAHRLDPLAGVELSEQGFRALTRGLLQLAEERCAGRLVSLLEGGYHLEALSRSVEAHVQELARAASCA
jgi:acetoin utilization deacetylase AcuC-like enzyme